MRRVSRLVIAMTAFAVLLLGASGPASADAPLNGTGFFIADDDGATFNDPTQMPALGTDFKRLSPQVYRLLVIWNAKEGPPAGKGPGTPEYSRYENRLKWVARAHAVIKKAKEQGVQQIIVTLRANGSGDLGSSSPDAYMPNSVKYELEAAKVVKEFAGEVDVWGGINEPNLWPQSDGTGTRAIPVSTLVEYQASIAEIVNVWDSSAMVTSPDFNDQTEHWKEYVEDYKTNGGGFGNVAAFHPYKAVEEKSMTRPNQYAAIVPSGRNIWVTEAGSRPFGNLTAQNERVQWMTNTSTGLASQDRITRIGYYHMRNHNPSWDSALLNEDLSPRPAWRTWCAAAHGNRPGDSDCQVDSDVNGDSLSDLVTLRPTGTAYVYPGKTNGTFAPSVTSFAETMDPAQYDGAGHYVIDVSDVTGDGRSDLVTLHSNGTSYVYPGTTTGAFGPSAQSFAGTMLPGILSPGGFEPIGVADVTGDGRGDFVAAHSNGNAYVYPGNANGTFAPSTSSFAGTLDSALHDGIGHYLLDVADVTGDGRADLVSLTSGGTVAVYPGQASGAFTTAALSFAGTMNPAMDDGIGHEPIGLGDVDGDLRADLVTLSAGTALVYRGKADGTFLVPAVQSFAGTMPSTTFGEGSGFEAATVVDVTGDGLADLTAAHTNGTVYTYRGQANGTFSTRSESFAATFKSTQHFKNQDASGNELVMEKPSWRRRGCAATGC
jgi:FG-GAP-like repeat/Glycosyl hydrolase catalytic core